MFASFLSLLQIFTIGKLRKHQKSRGDCPGQRKASRIASTPFLFLPAASCSIKGGIRIEIKGGAFDDSTGEKAEQQDDNKKPGHESGGGVKNNSEHGSLRADIINIIEESDMAVNVTRSGGIYISISGDYSQLQKDLEEVKKLAKANGKEISAALSGALSPAKSAGVVSDISRYMASAQAGAKGLAADLSGVEKRFRDIGEKLGVNAKNLEHFVRMNAKAFQHQTQTAFMDNLKGIQRLTGSSNAEMNKLAKSLGGVGNEFSGAAHSVKNFGSCIEDAVAKYAGLFIGAQSLQNAFEAVGRSALQMDRLNKSYATIYDSSVAAGTQLEYLYDVSDRLGLQFQTTAESAKGFFAAGKGSTLENQMNGIFESFSAAGAALSLNKEQMQRTFLALGQMISKGKVQAEELRGQLGEQLPGAFQIAARAMGMTTAELDKFMADGKLTAEMLLPRMREEIEKTFGGKAVAAGQGLQGQLNRFSTEWERLKASLVDSDALAGGVGAAAQSMKALADNGAAVGESIKNVTVALGASAAAWKVHQTLAGTSLTQVIGTASAARAAALARAEADMLAAAALQREAQASYHSAFAAAATTTAYREQIVAARALAAAEINLAEANALVAASQNAVAGAAARATTSSRVMATAAAGATASGRGLLALFGGPWGLALTAAAGAVAYLAMAESDAERAARSLGVNLKDVSMEYKHLADAAETAAQKTIELTNAQRDAARQKLAEAEKQRERLVSEIMKRGIITEEIDIGFVVEKEFATESVAKAYETYKKLFEEFKNKPLSIEGMERMHKALSDLDQAMQGVAASDTSFWKTNAAEANKLSTEIQFSLGLLKTLAEVLNKVGTVWKDSQPTMEYSELQREMGEYTKKSAEARKQIDAEYAKTSEGMKDALTKNVETARENFRLLGGDAEEAAKALAVLRKAEKELADLDKRGQSSALRSDLGEDRAIKAAADAYQKALEGAEKLTLQNIELKASLAGDDLTAQLTRAQRQYRAEIEAIGKQESDLMDKWEEWRKKGQLSNEAKESIANAVEQYAAQKDLLAVQRDINVELAERNVLESQLHAAADYAGLIGDARGYYDAQVKLLEIERDRLAGAEDITREQIKQAGTVQEQQSLERALLALMEKQLSVQEKLRREKARRDKNVGGLLETGFKDLAFEADEEWLDFYEKKVPDAFASSSDALADFISSAASGSKSVGDAWKDLGNSLGNILNQLSRDFMAAQLKAILFGNTMNEIAGQGGSGGNWGGGLVGMVGGLIGGLIGGLSSPSYSGTGSTIGTSGYSWSGTTWNAKGGAYSNGLSAYSNGIVASPTFFNAASPVTAYAKGGALGVMGEAGPEAIVPLSRDSRGRLGITATGLGGGGNSGGAQVFVNIRVTNTMADRAQVSVKETPTINGGMDIDLLIESKVNASIARGNMDAALQSRQQRAVYRRV